LLVGSAACPPRNRGPSRRAAGSASPGLPAVGRRTPRRRTGSVPGGPLKEATAPTAASAAEGPRPAGASSGSSASPRRHRVRRSELACSSTAGPRLLQIGHIPETFCSRLGLTSFTSGLYVRVEGSTTRSPAVAREEVERARDPAAGFVAPGPVLGRPAPWTSCGARAGERAPDAVVALVSLRTGWTRSG